MESLESFVIRAFLCVTDVWQCYLTQ